MSQKGCRTSTQKQESGKSTLQMNVIVLLTHGFKHNQMSTDKLHLTCTFKAQVTVSVSV